MSSTRKGRFNLFNSCRIMGIDYGDARIGVAFSDLSRTLVGETFTIFEHNPQRAFEKLVSVINESSVSLVVLGYPKNMDGTIGPRAEKSAELAKKLNEVCNIEVVLWDERRTTVDAHRILSESGTRGKKRKTKIDAVAASLILQGYLDSLSLSGSL